MPVCRLRHGDLPFTMLPIETVQAIGDVTALGMWCYLQSQNENWIIRQSQLCSHFRIGKDRCRTAVRQLRDLGLWEEEVEQGEDGKIIGRVVTIHYTILLKNRLTVEPSLGKPATNKYVLVTNKKTDNKLVQDSFLEFWKAYPKKQAKVAAEAAWKKIDGVSLLPTILKDLRRRWSKREKEFIPMPATYLRGRRWEDEDEVEETPKWI